MSMIQLSIRGGGCHTVMAEEVAAADGSQSDTKVYLKGGGTLSYIEETPRAIMWKVNKALEGEGGGSNG